jgi:phosphoenolpyruvate carboxylase
VDSPGKTMASVLNDVDLAGVLSISEMDETQKVDVLVTQQWLRVLVCQVQLRQPASRANRMQITSKARQSVKLSSSRFDQGYIIDTCKNLMQVLSKANRVPLEAHGIGMVSVASSTKIAS